MNDLPKIMIIDDTPANISVLASTLESAGYRVLVSESGMSALRRIPVVEPDLILMDVMMPGIDGYETCRRLKSRPDTSHIPIIFMTVRDSADDIVRGFQLGAADYITKPFITEVVLARVAAHLTIKQHQQQLEAERNKFEELLQQHTLELTATTARLAAEVENKQRMGRDADRMLELSRQLVSDSRAEPVQFTAWLHDVAGKIGRMRRTLEQAQQNNDDPQITNALLLEDKISHEIAFMQQLLQENQSLYEAELSLLDSLSERERDVLTLLAEGETIAEIAQALAVTQSAVRTYRLRLMEKLSIQHLPGLTRFALRHRLLDDSFM